MSRPIKPSETTARKKAILPTEVFKAFNDLIAENWDGKTASFEQYEVIARIIKLMNIERHEVFAKHYLDVEVIYRAEGWKVEYDRPGYNESYAATFTFTKK